MKQQIKDIKKIVRRNSTLIRQARKAKSFRQVIDIQDKWVIGTKNFKAALELNS